MNYDNIQFTDQDQLSGTTFKFENVGDSIKGTYVGKREGVKTQFGETTIYRIMNNEGVFSIFPNNALMDQMELISLGQIIEIKFTGTKPSNKGNDQKLYVVYGRADLVDTEWLDRQKLARELNPQVSDSGLRTEDLPNTSPQEMFNDNGGDDGEIKVENIDFGTGQHTPNVSEAPAPATSTQTATPPAAPAQQTVAGTTMTVEQKKARIAELATTKLGIPAGGDYIVPVMEHTKVAFTDQNLDEIIKILKA